MIAGQIIIVLDLGSLNLRILALEITTDGYRVVGVISQASKGIKNGEIVNVEEASSQISAIIGSLEKLIETDITEIHAISFNGKSIRSFNSLGVVKVGDRSREARLQDIERGTAEAGNRGASIQDVERARAESRNTEANIQDVERAIDSSCGVDIGSDNLMLHYLPREYYIDGKLVEGVPIGLTGTRLEVLTHIIICASTAIKNIVKSIEKTKSKPIEIIYSGLASSYATLSYEEQNRGVLLIDMGYGATSFQVFLGGAPIYTGSIPIGGYHTTSDLAQIFKISLNNAERLKLKDGCCWEALIYPNETVIIPGSSTSMAEKISKAEVCDVLKYRVVEILTMVNDAVSKQSINLNSLSGVVLVGGGSMLPGVIELAEDIFRQVRESGTVPLYRPVRVAKPIRVRDLKEQWYRADMSNIVGLALYAFEQNSKEASAAGTRNIEKPLAKFFNWIRMLFE